MVETDYRQIRLSIEDGRADVLIDRPPYNILNIETMRELTACFERLAADTTLRVVVLRAEGKAFSAGVDVGEHTGGMAGTMISSFSGMFRALWSISAVTVAAVHGAALGGGCELAAGCDIILASEKARFGQPEVAVGVFPPMAAVVFPRLIGRSRSIEWLLGGKVYSAAESQAAGLVAHVFAAEAFADGVDEYCARFTGYSAAVIAAGKKAIDRTAGLTLPEAMGLSDRIYLEELMMTADANEGLAAFLEKRAPIWKHN